MKRIIIPLLFILGAVSTQAGLSKTYPTSATTAIRIEAITEIISTIYNSTYTVSYSTHDWDTTTVHLINEILDKDVEQFMVWPDTTTLPEHGSYLGWCLSIVIGKKVYVSCP